VAAGAGTQLMSAVDRTISAMKQEETQLLSQRGQAANWAAVRLLVALALPMITTLVLLATVYWLMRRDRIQRAEAAEKFRLVVESCPTGIIMVDRFGRIALMNSETERLFGYRREEVLGQPIEVLVPQRFRPQHPQFLQKYMAQPEARSMGIGRDLYGLRKDGSEFPVEIGLHPTPGKDGMLVLAAIVDITERKQREEELRQYTARLQQSNRELQDFAYVSSHDLQEPLRKIQAFGDRLKSTCSASLPQQGNDCVERMQKAAARMRVLIEDLLKFSRVTSKAQPFAPVNLNEVIDDVLEDLEVRINATGAQISVAKLPVIDADPMQMRQLFQNLIGNALKFERPGVPPAIDIRADRLAGSDALPDSTLCEIIVTDNGIGFDNKYSQRIFDVFQRLHERDQYEGSGIGLSICRKIVERHCGSISAQGRPDEGATFVITLPVHQAAETRLETPSETLEEEMPCPRVEEAFSC
jgi:two-component system sensor kinase FixL